MNQKEFIIKMIPLVMQIDIRLQVHNLYEVEADNFGHSINKCSRCQALYILGIESDWIDPIDLELSTGKDLQSNKNCDTIEIL